MRGRQDIKELENNETIVDRFTVKARLNLNDLLKRKIEEKKVDKKANIIIFSSTTLVAAVVLIILSL